MNTFWIIFFATLILRCIYLEYKINKIENLPILDSRNDFYIAFLIDAIKKRNYDIIKARHAAEHEHMMKRVLNAQLIESAIKERCEIEGAEYTTPKYLKDNA